MLDKKHLFGEDSCFFCDLVFLTLLYVAVSTSRLLFDLFSFVTTRMASSEGKPEMQQIDLSKLNIQQLNQLKQQLDQVDNI